MNHSEKNRYKTHEVLEILKNHQAKKTLEELHPNAPKKTNYTRTKEHEDYINDLLNKRIVENYYGKMMTKATNFNQDLYKKYHKAYVTISNFNSEFTIKVKTTMSSKLSPDEKWEQYKKIINQGIKDWNKAHIENPDKQLKELGN